MVTLPTGAAGGAGTAFIITVVTEDVQPFVLFCAVTTYVPGVSALKLFDDWYAAPMLYVIFAPDGDDMLMVPVGVIQVGCVEEATGVAGGTGIAFIVSRVAVEIQPVTTSLTVTG